MTNYKLKNLPTINNKTVWCGKVTLVPYSFFFTFTAPPPNQDMFSSLSPFVALLATVHSFTFVAAIAEPQITPAPHLDRRQGGVAGGPGTPILSNLHYSFSNLPEQVYPFPVLRGPQLGYNICNSTTQGNASLCQTLIVNSAVCLFFFFLNYK